ncbi:MAG: hypothetical protein LBQ47_07960, partial [Endomicrobium sp.]|nr:hypothetical protein [Endomicrobium sp.]
MFKKHIFLTACFIFFASSFAFAQSNNRDLYIVNADSLTVTQRSFLVPAGAYNIDESLGVTGAGDFVVSGAAAGAQNNILSGVLISANGAVLGTQGSFFKIRANTIFNLFNVTVSSAYASGDGSVINANNASSGISVSSAIFDDNRALRYGGAVYSYGTSKIFLNGGIIFANNKANYGGAIFNQGARIENSGSVFFSSNTASYGGGAVHNYQGGVFISTQNSSFLSFAGNAALQNGGAFFNEGSVVLISSAQFVQNQAASGGAVFNTGTADFSSVYFSSNAAQNGGALYNSGVISVSSGVFNANTAGSYGGALFNAVGATANLGDSDIVLNAAVSGGGVYVSSASTLNLNGDNISLSYNTALSSGGALYVEKFGRVNFNAADTGAFGNTAVSGGGFLYLAGSGADIDLDKIHIASNSARQGGSIYADAGSKLNFSGNGSINFSSASDNGGAIYLGAEAVADFSSATFSAEGNYAQKDGGFLYLDGGCAYFKDVELKNNAAGGKGGAIYAVNSRPFGFSAGTSHYLIL